MQAVRDQRLIAEFRRELRPADLEALREIRARYAAEGQIQDAGRLACEEGTILLTINDHGPFAMSGQVSVDRGSDDELDAIVADYFDMLGEELAKRPYVKSHHSAACRFCLRPPRASPFRECA